MTVPVLRPYQAAAVEQLVNALTGKAARMILVAATGSGKTVIGAEVIRKLDERTLVLAHRREIVMQTSAKLHALDVDHGILMNGFPSRPGKRVQVASVATLHTRAMRSRKIELPEAGLVVVDECHHATAETWRALIAAYPDAAVLGMTATPCRGDGRGLGGIFSALIECPQVQELIDLGHLVPTRCYAPATPDLAGIKVQAGDWVETQLAERMDRPKLVGDIVTHWHRLAEGRRTVVFATGVQHSVHIRDEFAKAGVTAEHLDGSTPKDERDAILARLASGETRACVNCMVLTEGWDMPDIGCIVLARPTRKMGLFRQMIGRGLRPAEDKRDCIVIDHSGAIHRHGFVEEQVTWTLDPERVAATTAHETQGGSSFHSRICECSQCGALRLGGEACPACGFKPAPRPQYVPVRDEDLVHLTRDRRRHPHEYTATERNQWHRELAWIARERGYKPGWTFWKYKEKFEASPPGGEVMPLPPSPEVKSWVRSRMIAWAKSQHRDNDHDDPR
jgi:superfamily II DNA or RNA helicase